MTPKLLAHDEFRDLFLDSRVTKEQIFNKYKFIWSIQNFIYTESSKLARTNGYWPTKRDKKSSQIKGYYVRSDDMGKFDYKSLTWDNRSRRPIQVRWWIWQGKTV